MDYSKLGLKANPFPRIPIPENPPRVTYDGHKVSERIVREALFTYTTGFSNTLTLVGPYGSGKTHYMLSSAAKIAEMRGTLVVYVPSPGYSFTSLFRSFISALGVHRLAELVDENAEDPLDRALRLLKDEKLSEIAYSWVMGESIEGNYRFRLGLKRLDEHSMVAIMGRIIERLYNRGFTSYIFLDEVESLLDLPQYKRGSYFSMLRRLLDTTPRGLFVAFSVTPAGWDALLTSAYALARRISRNVVFIKPLSLDDARNVLRSYISTVAVTDTFPFSSEALEELYKASNGIVGELVKLAGLALEIAALRGASTVSREDVLEALGEYGGAEGMPLEDLRDVVSQRHEPVT